MRALTEEELALAPEWATHYIVNIHGDVIYQNDDSWWWSGMSTPLQNHAKAEFGAKPIPRRPFDITKYEFSDGDLSALKAEGGIMWIDIEYGGSGNRDVASAVINNLDAIAIARALGVTAEDLK